eukprot:9680021-Prorocentrum_lima.AAC.1
MRQSIRIHSCGTHSVALQCRSVRKQKRVCARVCVCACPYPPWLKPPLPQALWLKPFPSSAAR